MHKQQGAVLLEALIGIFLFLVGVLGLAGLYVASMKNAGEAEYRAEAAMLANSMIAEMRVANASTRASSFVADGEDYIRWTCLVKGYAPPSSGSDCGERLQAAGLPDASAPTVSFNGNAVTVTLGWRAKNDTSTRQYIVTAVLE